MFNHALLNAITLKKNNNISFNTIDKNGKQKFQQMSKRFTNDDIARTTQESIYLLSKEAIVVDDECKNRCDVSTCKFVCRLLDVLAKYKDLMQHKDNDHTEFNLNALTVMFDNNGKAPQVINYFHHLLAEHQHQFEDIHNTLIKQCNKCISNDCLMMRRNYRSRTCVMESKDELQTLYFNDDKTNIVLQQIMDIIHCYYYHSIDIGYRLSAEERQTIQKEIDSNCNEGSMLLDHKLLNMKQIIKSKQGNIDKTRHSKYNSLKIETKLDDKKFYEPGVFFDYGNRCACYQDEDVLIVSPLYHSLEEEILNNKFISLAKEQWVFEMNKAQLHFDCLYRKTYWPR
eukprot:202285_1